ncbi:Adenine deaminase [Candidatus Bealeia paramacronuclearis]|uniref:Adenine deaminase n=1 Tax=Candidatus Bealeia paramacronuclearis TaxID=1921001 RepID=A0ABZ2C5W6_9PROT|nr:Adenine deaminase [Candidatus Bealeia paramacronuclearis]
MITKQKLKSQIDSALGRQKCDLVIKNCSLVNVITGEITPSDVAVCDEKIVGIYENYEGHLEIDGTGLYAVPGFIDTHVHIESSHLTPYEFSRCVLPHGTTTAICDPHEITNVLGKSGLEYFLEASSKVAIDLFVQLSSCVPATSLETSGADLLAEDLARYKDHPAVIGLAEMMNYPGLLSHDDVVLDKLLAFSDRHIDGHCPLVRGKKLNAYISCGIKNCHESTSYEEAYEKLSKGMQVLIREGSASKDLKELSPLLTPFHSPFLALCSDDRNPLDISEEGHIDYMIRKAIQNGAPLMSVYRAATWSAALGFGLKDRGLLAPGHLADIVLLENLEECRVHTVIKRGTPLSQIQHAAAPLALIGRNSIQRAPVKAEDFIIHSQSPEGPVIGLIPNSLLTDHLILTLPFENGQKFGDLSQDILKIAVVARHGTNQNIGRGFVKGFGISSGALASSMGHDSHNITVVGTNDADMAIAVNRIIALEGGFVAVQNGQVLSEMPLPLAGLMSFEPLEVVKENLRHLRSTVKEKMKCPLNEPFLQLAFLPLPVIPHLKITDYGLVDVNQFQVIAA